MYSMLGACVIRLYSTRRNIYVGMCVYECIHVCITNTSVGY